MKEIEIFYLTGCPYCKDARKAVDKLMEEERLSALSVRWIEERQEKALADSRDYYYVPTVYVGGEKVYEASPRHDYGAILSNIRTAFEKALLA